MFKISTLTETATLKTDLLVLFFDESFQRKKNKRFDYYPADIQQLLKNFLKYKDFKGKFKENMLFYPNNDSGIKRILLVGLGASKKLDRERIRTLGFEVSKIQEKTKAGKTHILFPEPDEDLEDRLPPFVEGVYFHRYRFNEFKKGHKPSAVKYTLFCKQKTGKRILSDEVHKTEIGMRAVKIARDLANQPSNICTPEYVKSYSEKLFKGFEQVTIEALDLKQLRELQFGAMLAVARGSRELPCLVIIQYKPDQPTNKRLAVIGKGVTFDSGGISIKPSNDMDKMKFDMAGGAATIAFLHAAAELKPPIEILGAIPLVENMPGSSAFKPGDIIKSYNGKNIEILNTDAEGRLILADTIAYMEKRFNPGVIIDFATLTGSVLAALGDKAAGLFTHSTPLQNLLFKAGEKSGDRVWPLPLWDIYDQELKSDVADIKNLGGRWGGAISAAKFLEFFVRKSKWAHIDMAGTAYNVQNIDYLNKGATGYGPRLLLHSLDEMVKLL